MKKILYILIFALGLQTAFAQDEGPGEIKLREKMIEYIQTKLSLSRAEAEKFQPVFINYFRELKRTNHDYKGLGRPLELQQKLLEVRMRYRDQFKPIIGEQKSNEVFTHERDFLKSVRQEINERRQDRIDGRADKRKNSELLLPN